MPRKGERKWLGCWVRYLFDSDPFSLTGYEYSPVIIERRKEKIVFLWWR